MKSNWNTAFRVVFSGKFPGVTGHLKRETVFPEGVFQTESRVSFVQTKFQALAALFSVKGTDLRKWETQLQNEIYQP